jgi:uncharacterized Zn finger protein (UPF0148 family)
MTKVVCPHCGTISEVKEEQESENWLECVLPTGFEWSLPSGKIKSAAGTVYYVDSIGNKMSREAYIEKYKIDPEIAYNNMRGEKPKKVLKLGKH